MKARYLTIFSYIGTPFRSSEKMWIKGGKNYNDPLSIQGLMELSLLKFRSLNYPNVILSSRTDGGVHALNSSAHFDLEKYGTNIYEPNDIIFGMNKYFFKNNISICINQCYRVPDDFHARFQAIRRSYLFRLAVRKQEPTISEYRGIGSYIPIEEWKRCFFVSFPEFDIEKLKEGARYFEGYHDFTTFKRHDKLNSQKHNRRELYSIDVVPGKPLVTGYTHKEQAFEYWDIIFNGRAFVHNQIRRMMATLIGVAIGKLQPADIKLMLQVPSKHSWHTFLQNCPPDGLYLREIEYNPQDLIYNPDSAKKKLDNFNESDSESE